VLIAVAFLLAVRRLLGPFLTMLGQTIRDEPSQPTAGASIVAWWKQIGVVEAARRHVDLVRGPGMLEGQLGPAARTERPSTFLGRIEPVWHSIGEAEIR